jgi:hypothetical protein
MRENEPFTARHPLWFKITAYGFLLYLVTLAMIFLLSFVLSNLLPQNLPDDTARGYSLALAVSALPLALAAYLIARHIAWPKDGRTAAALGGGWAGVQLVLNFFVAIPNGNLAMIFTSPSTYLIYLAVFAGALASRLHRD